MDKMKDKLEEVLSIVARYDEVLCDKAQKHSLI